MRLQWINSDIRMCINLSCDEKMKIGYWSIAAQKHIKKYEVESPNRDEFDAISFAGKVGRFIGIIRGNDEIRSIDKIEKMAGTVGIYRHELHKLVLPEIKRLTDGQVEVITDSTGDAVGLKEYILGKSRVLEIAGEVFESNRPKDIERIAIETMDMTCKMPHLQSELYDKLMDQGFKENRIDISCILQSQFKLIQKLTRGKEPIFSNEYVWGENHEKIAYAITSLSLDNKTTLKETVDAIQQYQGLPIDNIKHIDKKLVTLAQQVGMINPTNIATNRGITKAFAFSSDLVKKSLYDDDIVDDVKLFIAGIRFGQNYTQHSTLTRYVDFINTLINEGRTRRPHSANGTDYVLLERRGIIRVEPSSMYPGRYYMVLLRKDVAQEALKVLSSPKYNINDSDDSNEVNSILSQTSFESPEECRMKMAEPTEDIKEAMDHLTRTLRDESLGG